MAKIGDVLQANAHWRTTMGGTTSVDHAEDLFIAIEVNEGFDGRPRYGSLNTLGPGGTWSAQYVDLIHELHTAEARAIHEQYPAYQGRDYFWYCEQRGVEPYRTPLELEEIAAEYRDGQESERIQEPLPWQQWQPGDVLERIGQAYEGNHGFGGHAIAMGEEVTVSSVGDYGVDVVLANGTIPDFRYSRQHFRFVRRPAATAADLSTVPASEWRVGDTVRRVAATRETSYGVVGQEYQVTVALDGQRLIGTNAYIADRTWYIPPADLVLVRRATTPAPLPNGLPRNTDVGARVLIAATSKAGSITSSGGSNYRVYVDGESSYSVYTAAELLPLTQEPEPPKLPEAFTSCWLDCSGLTKEEVQEFVEQVISTTSLRDVTGSDNGYGTLSTGLKVGSNGRRGGLHYNGEALHYYQNDSGRSSYPDGLLMRDWNQVLNRLRQRHGNVRQGRNPFAGTQPPPPKLHAMAKLPHYFVLEAKGNGSTEEVTQRFFAEHGFTGYRAKYALFSGNSVVGTALKGAAEAFQRKHNCVWFNATEDKVLLNTLFTQRKNMLTTQAAQQRFAIDVAASGPHLIVAFKAFMASIGYRQENAAKEGGPYILLNGGNIYANQPATWQYSDVKNNRCMLLNLAEAAANPGADGMSGKSGWEKLGERLANRGVALPVLDAEDLDRSPIAGDKVCLVFNDVQEGYPETEADLRAHTCGQQYTVKSLIGGLCLLTETGLRLHPDRLQVLEQPLGLQNGDQVVMTQAYGEHLSEGQVLTLFNGTLVAADNTAYAVPTGMYTAVTNELLTANLLRRYGITLPCVVKVTSEEFPEHVGHEVVLSTAWPLNNQELAFWTEDTVEKDAWFTRDAFQVIVADSTPEQPAAWKVLKGATRETTVVQIGETMIPLSQLEEAIAA